tara:strand:- start:966 stop:1349 length:384 start_codon:yes stop_codon:yes gene_type:complete
MVNDTIDILDATIVNFGINFVAVIDPNTNRFTALNRANTALRVFISENQYDIGESIQITDFYKVLQKVPGIVDVEDLEIVGKSGAQYADLSYDFIENLSPTGQRVNAANNIVFELKYPNVDVKGSVR